MWIKDRFFKYATGLLLVLLIIFFLGKLDFLLVPLQKFISILFFPIIVAGLLFYLLRPLVHMAEKLRIPRVLAIVAIFLALIILFSIASAYAGTLIAQQANQLVSDLPSMLLAAREKTNEILNNESMRFVFNGKLEQQLGVYLQNLIPALSNSIIGFLGALTSIAAVLVVIPFILFYLLKDEKKFSSGISSLIPAKYRDDVGAILSETDKTLSVYITGQAIVALVLGTLMYIGYLIIGINYSLILALFALVTSFIPMFGSIIGIIPAVIVSLGNNPFMAVKVIIIMIIVQQIEGNLVSPLLIGKRLNIHPLTLILLFLVAASLYGFIGMLIAVPVYAVLKVIISGARRIYLLRKAR